MTPSPASKRAKPSPAVLDAQTAELLSAFEAHLRDERQLAARTVGFYTDDVRRFAAWLRGQKPPRFLAQPDTVTHLLARRYLGEVAKRGNARTVRRRITSLRALWRWLLAEGKSSRDPLVAIDLPRVPCAPNPAPSVDEVARLLDSMADEADEPSMLRDRALLETIYATGAGVGQMAALSLADWSERSGDLRLGVGTPQERQVPIGREARRALGHYLAVGRPILLERAASPARSREAFWLSERGLPLSSELMYQVVRRRANAAGLPRLTPHALRRACGIHLLRAGAAPYEVARLLGCRSTLALASYLEEANTPTRATLKG